MNPQTLSLSRPHQLADDILRGAVEIGDFLFGNRNERRRVYYLATTSRLPVFRMGSMICARKSVLLKWIQDQEERRGSNGGSTT